MLWQHLSLVWLWFNLTNLFTQNSGFVLFPKILNFFKLSVKLETAHQPTARIIKTAWDRMSKYRCWESRKKSSGICSHQRCLWIFLSLQHFVSYHINMLKQWVAIICNSVIVCNYTHVLRAFKSDIVPASFSLTAPSQEFCWGFRSLRCSLNCVRRVAN